MSPALEVVDLRRAFDGRPVLDGVSLRVDAGEVVSIVGASGSGKSTLLRLLTGALDADDGTIAFGEPGPRPFAFMPQRDVLLPWRSVLDNTAIGLEVAGVPVREARRRAAELFEPFGLAGTERMHPRLLSGGMRQRAAFLRTVVQGQSLLLLDEPFGALDAITRDELQRWLLGMWERSRWSIVLITHDIREAVRMSDRVLVLGSGRIAGAADVTRDIPRGDGFALDARVGRLEERIHGMLRAAGPDR